MGKSRSVNNSASTPFIRRAPVLRLGPKRSLAAGALIEPAAESLFNQSDEPTLQECHGLDGGRWAGEKLAPPAVGDLRGVVVEGTTR